jgi:hypothetical protein
MVIAENKTYSDWDSLQITLVNGEDAKATIRMMRQDIEVIEEAHGMERQEVIGMMIAAMEDEWRQKADAEVPTE